MRISNVYCCKRAAGASIFLHPGFEYCTEHINKETKEKNQQFLFFPKDLNIPLMEECFVSNNP